MIIETAIISVAAIFIASLMAANAIHKRAVAAEDINAAARRQLQTMKNEARNSRATCPKDADIREWTKEIMRIDAELLKLAKDEQ